MLAVVRSALFGKDSESDLVSVQNGEYRHLPGFFTRSESDHYFQMLQNAILWKDDIDDHAAPTRLAGIRYL